MKRVFLDASFWIALRDPREPFHSRARTVTAECLRQHCTFIYTSLILAETHAYFSRSERIRWQILDDADRNPALHCEPVSILDHEGALALLRERRDRTYSYCDAVSFVVIRRLGRIPAAAFDDHFRQFGEFEVLGP